jgi:peptidoglycan/LPS O-acetylase OafA/YrhL
VVLYHGVPHVFQSSGQPMNDSHFFLRFVSLGYISVSFFFMLSGFILALVYLKENEPIHRRKFFVSRFARIYPLLFAAVMLDLPHFLYIQQHVKHATVGNSIATIFATLGLVNAWFSNLDGLNPPSWSLSVELLFYLLFPLLAPSLWKIRRSLLLPVGLLLYVGGLFLVKAVDGVQIALPISHLFVFLLGIVLARGFLTISLNRQQLTRLQTFAPWMMAASLALFLCFPAFDLQISQTMLQHGLLAPLFALAILAFASDNVLIDLLFSAKWLVLLGEASFSLYLIHYPIGFIFRRPIERFGTPMFLLYLGLVVGLSILSLKLLEIPARRWILERERVRSPETLIASSIAQ